MGLGPLRNGTPWYTLGRNPDAYRAAPPRGPRGPDCNTTNPGRLSLSLPRPYVSHAPMLGRPNCGEPVLTKHFAGPWLNTSVFIPRTQHRSSAISLWDGSMWLMVMPHLPTFSNFRGVPRSFASPLMNANRLPLVNDSGTFCPLSLFSSGLGSNRSS